MEKPLWEQQSFPEKLFRLSGLICIVGWGLSVIYIASHVGPLEAPPVRTPKSCRVHPQQLRSHENRHALHPPPRCRRMNSSGVTDCGL